MKKKILVIDDDVGIIHSIQQCIGKIYDVVSAVNGLIALNILTNQDIDAVITDMRLPIIDGGTLINIMYKEEKWKNIPIIVISGYSMDPSSFPENVKTCLGKPIQVEELLFAIAELFK